MKKIASLFFISFIVFLMLNINVNAQVSQITSSSISLTSSSGRVVAKDSLGNYYVTYYNSSNQVFVRKTEDNGATWKYWNGSTFDVTGTETFLGTGYYPSISIDSGNNIHLVYGYTDGMYYSKYTYADNTWSTPIKPYTSTGSRSWSNVPAIDIDSSNNLHIAWSGFLGSGANQINYIKYNSSSLTWSTPMSFTSESYDQSAPSIAVSNTGKVMIVWTGRSISQPTYDQVRYVIYDGSWSPVYNMTNYASVQQSPTVAVAQDGIFHLVWNDNSSGAIRYANYNGSWSVPKDLVTGTVGGIMPSIGVDSSNNIHISYRYNNSPDRVRYIRYSGSWMPSLDLTSGSYYQINPSISRDGSIIIWQGTSNSTGVSSGYNGAMFYDFSTLNPYPGTPTITETGDYGDGRDINVSFSGSSDETNITEYRIIVVPSGMVQSFNEPTATALASTKYQVEAKNGNGGLHSVNLAQSLLDSSGMNIANGEPYRIYIMAVGSNGRKNVISAGSTPITLTEPVTKSPSRVTALYQSLGGNNAKSLVKDSLGNYYVAFYNSSNYTIFVRKSEDGGLTWKHWNGSSFDFAGDEISFGTGYYPALDVDKDNNVYLAWGYHDYISYTKYTSSTGTWSIPIKLAGVNYVTWQNIPAIRVDSNNNVHLVFQGYISGNSYSQIRYTKLDASTNTWSTIKDITNENYAQNKPSIDIDASGNIYVVWSGKTSTSQSNDQIRYAFNLNGTWTSASSFTNETSAQQNPSIAIDSSNNLHVVWNDSSNTVKYSMYNGNWSTPVTIASSTAGGMSPSIAIDASGTLNVVYWYNNSPTKARYLRYKSSWTPPMDLTSGNNSVGLPNITRNAEGMVSTGTIDINGVCTSFYGISFYNFSNLTPIISKPAVSEIGDLGDGRDINVSFTAPSDETNISEYRIIVAPSMGISSFYEGTASSLASGRYLVEPKGGNGASHSVNLTQTLTDINGITLAEGEPYKIFILAVGQNGCKNSLSEGSDYITLTSPPKGKPSRVKALNVNVSYNGARSVAKDSLGNIYVAFANGYTDVYVRKSDDGGLTWKYWNGASYGLNGSEERIGSGYSPSLTVDSQNNIHAVFIGYDGVFHSIHSSATGKWQSTPTYIAPTNATSSSFSISSDIDKNDNIHIAFSAYNGLTSAMNIRYAKYTASTHTWSTPTNISLGTYQQYNPTIAASDNGNIFIAWYGASTASPAAEQARYSIFDSGSGTWSTAAELTTGTTYMKSPTIAVGNNNIAHLVWYDNNSSIFYSKYSGSWSQPLLIGTGISSGSVPVIAADNSNNLHIVYMYNNSPTKIRYIRYTNSWLPAIDLTSGSFGQSWPSIDKYAKGLIWKGTTDLQGNGINSNGIMYYDFGNLNPAPQKPVASDISDNGNAGDIQVSFVSASDETNISEYRILVVPSSTSQVFYEGTATSLASDRYLVESKNGNGSTHIVVLPQTLKDINANLIVNGEPYSIYIWAVGINGFKNNFSEGSNFITLTKAQNTIPSVVKSDNISISYNNARSIARDSKGNYYTTFSGPYNGSTRIFVRYSDNGGLNWKYWNGNNFGIGGPEVPIENYIMGSQSSPIIAIDKNDILHLVWLGRINPNTTAQLLAYSKYNTKTNTWTSPIGLTGTNNGQYSPSMVLDESGSIYLTWQEIGSSNERIIRFMKFDNSTGIWSAPITVSTGVNYQWNPSIAVDSLHNVYIIWTGNSSVSPSTSQTRFVKYTASTNTWSSTIDMTSGGNGTNTPAIIVDKNDVIHAVWTGYSGFSANNIIYARSTDGANSWETFRNLTPGNYGQSTPSIAVDPINTLHIVFSGNYAETGSIQQIRYMKSEDGGTTWSSVQNLTSGSINMAYPSLSEGAYGFVWKGITNNSGVSSSTNGLMFKTVALNLVAPKAGTPTVQDISDLGDSRDISLTFIGADDETNISQYRIFVVKEGDASTFDVATASALDNSRYFTENTNGNKNTHSITLPQGLLDTSGSIIANIINYKVFIMAVGKDVYKNSLSAPTDTFALTAHLTAVNEPIIQEGVLINKAAESVGIHATVSGLSKTGAYAGDTLELLLDGNSFAASLTKVLDNNDLQNDSYTFIIPSGSLGIDGDRNISARLTDTYGNTGDESTALTITLDLTEPVANVDNIETAVNTQINVSSSEDGTIYLVPQGMYNNISDLESAITSGAGVKTNVFADTQSTVTAPGIVGDYKAYAVDAAGNISIPSSGKVTLYVITPLQIPAKPTLVEGIASWESVANENNGYIVRLYKDGSLIKEIYTSHDAPLTHDFTSDIIEAGSYTVTVTARGVERYSDSLESLQSNPQVIVLNTDDRDVQTVKDSLTFDVIKGQNTDIGGITSNLNLITSDWSYGVNISWASSNVSVITTDGLVRRPLWSLNDTTVNLTATLSKGSYSDTKVFTTIVKKLPPPASTGTIAIVPKPLEVIIDQIKDSVVTSKEQAANAVKDLTTVISENKKDLSNDSIKNKVLETASKIVESASKIDSAKMETSITNNSLTLAAKSEDLAKAIETASKIVDELKSALESSNLKDEAKQLSKEVVISTKDLSAPKGAEVRIALPITAVEKAKANDVSLVIEDNDVKMKMSGETLNLKEASIQSTDSKNVEIQISNKSTSEKLPRSSEVKPVGNIYEFTASAVIKDESGTIEKTMPVTRFNDYITIEISLDKDTLKNYKNTDSLGVYTYNETNKKWEYVSSSIDLENMKAIFKTPHFSKYALMSYTKKFSDVPVSNWAHKYINALASKQITDGVDENHFSPRDKVTRAQFAAFLVRALDIPQSNADNQVFKDVSLNKWYAKEVAAAKAAGLVEGVGEGRFDPEATITREEMAAMIVRAYEKISQTTIRIDKDITVFNDMNKVSNWAKDYVLKLKSSGIISGMTQNLFIPKSNMQRDQTAKMIVELLNKLQ